MLQKCLWLAPPPSSLHFMGSEGKRPFARRILVQWGRCWGVLSASEGHHQRVAGVSSALYPPPGKSPLGRLSAESGWIKPLAKEFSRAKSNRMRRLPEVRSLGPGSSFRRPLRQPSRVCPSLADSVLPPVQAVLPDIPMRGLRDRGSDWDPGHQSRKRGLSHHLSLSAPRPVSSVRRE